MGGLKELRNGEEGEERRGGREKREKELSRSVETKGQRDKNRCTGQWHRGAGVQVDRED